MTRLSGATALWRFALILAALAGCSDNPVDSNVACDHFDADGVLLESGGSPALQWGGDVAGAIELLVGSDATLQVTFLDPDSQRVVIGAECPDHGLRWTIDDTTVVGAVAPAGDRWAVRLEGRAAGETTLRVRLWHGEHADFTSLPFTVRVAAAFGAQALRVMDGPSAIATWNYHAERGANQATGPILVALNGRRAGLAVEFLGAWSEDGGEAVGRPVLPLPEGPLEVEWLVADESVAAVETGGSAGTFDIVGRTAGTTTARIRLLSGAIRHYESGPFIIRVVDPAALEAPPDFYVKKNGVDNLIVLDGSVVAAACGRTARPGRLEAELGALSDLFFVKLLDHECDSVDPSSTRDVVAFEFADRELVRVVMHPTHWGERNIFHFEGLRAGETTVRMTFLRDGVPRWMSPPLPVRVHAS